MKRDIDPFSTLVISACMAVSIVTGYAIKNGYANDPIFDTNNDGYFIDRTKKQTSVPFTHIEHLLGPPKAESFNYEYKPFNPLK